MLEARALRLSELSRRRVLRDAEWIVGDRARALATLGGRARRAIDARVDAAAARLQKAHTRLERKSPHAELARAGARLESAEAALRRAAKRRIERADDALRGLARSLEATSPLAVLARGYSVTTKDGAAVVDAGSLASGDVLTTRLSRGSVVSRVESVDGDEGA